MKKLILAGMIITMVMSAGVLYAQTLLDDLLNYPYIHAKVPVDPENINEGMHFLANGTCQWQTLSKEKPLGQTFKTGPDTIKLWRIATGICHWPDKWGEEEAVTFTVWDSPKKNTKLYSRTLTHREKWHKWDIVFDIYMDAKPNTEYYFEITHNGGGDNDIPVVAFENAGYSEGTAYIAGKPVENLDLYFLIFLKKKPDTLANMNAFLDRFDYTRPELAKAKELRDAGKLRESAQEILKAFESNLEKEDKVWKPKPDEKIDLFNQDKMTDENRLYQFEDGKQTGNYMRFDKLTNWREVWPGESDLRRQNDIFYNLAIAWRYTKNEKYIKKLNEMVIDYLNDNPSPFDGGQWTNRTQAMGAAWRLGDGWDFFANAMDSKAFQDDVRLAWINHNARMAEFATIANSGGNQRIATAEGVMGFANRFPLYRDSGKWFTWGFENLSEETISQFRKDGGFKEPAMNYHGFTIANMMSGMETARKYGAEIPKEMYDTLERALSYTAYSLMPNGQIPPYGDTGAPDFRPNQKLWNGFRDNEARTGAEKFNRKDLLYIATAGKEGERPSEISKIYPDTKHYFLRSGWGKENGEGFEDELWLFLRGGYFGSHGHWDMNMIMLYAYGRPLLLDPGRTTYGTPLMFELTEARSHNVLLVEGKKMNRVDGELQYWHTSKSLDIVGNLYKNLYDNTDHNRTILLVRPDYFVMFDKITHQGTQKAGINFWMTPPDANINRTDNIVISTEPEGSNILLHTVGSSDITITDRKGEMDLGGKRNDIPVVTFWQQGGNLNFTTLMYPSPKGITPDAKITAQLNLDNASLVEIQTPKGKDYVFYSFDGIAEPKMKSENTVSFKGKAGVISFDANKNIKSLSLADGTRVSANGNSLVRSTENIKDICVEYTDDKVIISSKEKATGLKIASMGRKTAEYNGKNIKVDGAIISID
ncbi:MAG: heparinase II/III family protein [Armatimonadota bacterium]